MPGWINIPVSAGDDMSLRATYLELMGAWNECRQMLSQATVSDPAVGDPCFQASAAYSIKEMQDWVEANCTSFVVSHDAGSPPTLRADGYYAGAATIDLYTLSTFRSTAGLNSGGFTKTDSPTYGIAAVGDVVLKEHFNELRLAFNVLAWTKLAASWSGHGESNQRVLMTGSFATWNLAYAAAAAAWVGTAAGAVSPGGEALCHGTFDGVNYQCGMERYYGYGEFSGIPNFTSHKMDVYLYTAIAAYDEANGTYFAHGDGVIQDKFALMQSFASATTTTRTTAKLGQIAATPSQGPAPTGPPPAPTSFAPYGWGNRVAGGASTDPQGVIRWDKAYS